jgi:hypothetical protein
MLLAALQKKVTQKALLIAAL